MLLGVDDFRISRVIADSSVDGVCLRSRRMRDTCAACVAQRFRSQWYAWTVVLVAV